MKPCSKNRKHLVLLAARGVDSRLERELRAHIENCDGCRSYLHAMTHVTEKLTAGNLSSDLAPSATFHKNFVRKLEAEQSKHIWEKAEAYFRLPLWTWRIALPAISATALVMVGLVMAFHSREIFPRSQSGKQPVSVARPIEDVAPTISNYRNIANRSLERLDEVLAREEMRSSSPAPVYTASTLPRVNEME